MEIGSGLTGIVGPNGCGKSNLVEALKWAMGESAPGRVRLGEMSEIIFAGTDKRPPRNIAEVRLSLGELSTEQSVKWGGASEVEVCRRLERGGFSKWYINNQAVRGTDVSMLLADAATGARTAAIIGQGEVTRLVRCNPQERRAVLEEAAGVGGIKVRRGEAAAKLKATETNLIRVGDLAEQLAEQHSTLGRQARQAERYRRLGENIRRLEAQRLWFHWDTAKTAERQSKLALATAAENKGRAERLAEELAARQVAAFTAAAEAAERLAASRRTAAEAENEGRELERAMRGWHSRLADAETRLAEWRGDLDSAAKGERTAAEALARLQTEQAELEAITVDGDDELLARRQLVQKRLAAIAAGERAAAAEQKQRLQLQLQVEALRHRLEERKAAESQTVARLKDVAADSTAAAKALKQRRGEAAAAEAVVKTATVAAAKLQTTVRGLELGLRLGGMPSGVKVEVGFENAVAVCLATAADFARPWGWRGEPSSESRAKPPPLPEGVEPLRSVVTAAPDHLAVRLDYCGLVDEKFGHSSAARLAVGQRLVSKQGALWRWDGYSSPPLNQETLVAERDKAQAAERAAAAARSALAEAAAGVTAAERHFAEQQSRQARLEESLAETESVKVAAELAATEKRLGDTATATAAADTEDKEKLLAEEAFLAAKIAAAAQVAAEHQSRRRNLEAERQRWQSASADAKARLESLKQRRLRAEELLNAAAATEEGYQKRIRANRSRLDAALKELEAAEKAHRGATDIAARTAAECEHTADAANKAAQEWARAEGAAKPAADAVGRSYQELLGQFPQDPLSLPQTMGFAADKPPPAGELERLRRSKEGMGEVNLRAAEDFKAVDERLAALHREREEIATAAAKLKLALGRLKSEENSRMSTARNRVDKLFAELFTRLFSGGEAALQEVADEENGSRGLEVLVRLPGRKRQRLSVLSGGEQALVALALVFAVFLANPGPICVLDEVDAPLDDANADKFCRLLKEVNERSRAPIIIITHRPLTMSEMTRLQGVTMAEKGVSDFITVDLERALEFAA